MTNSKLITAEIVKVILNLIGHTNPVGDSAIDSVRLENTKTLVAVFDSLHTVIDDLAENNKNSQYYSEKAIGMYCNEYLDKLFSTEDLDNSAEAFKCLFELYNDREIWSDLPVSEKERICNILNKHFKTKRFYI